MGLIKRKWTPDEAEEWTKEDLFACILSSLVYITLIVGTALSFLLIWTGFVILAIGIILAIIMFFIIDPKLKTISDEYEKKQKSYLENLEKIERWE